MDLLHKDIEAAAKEQRQAGAVLLPQPTTVAGCVAVVSGSVAFKAQSSTPIRAGSMYATNMPWDRKRPAVGQYRTWNHTSNWKKVVDLFAKVFC